MKNKIYIGNLPFKTTEEELKNLFVTYGNIEQVMIITNKFSGKSKGFGFVTFSEEGKIEKAISEMNKKDVDGREIIVKEAVPFDPDKFKKPESDKKNTPSDKEEGAQYGV